jgi:hypothetical protein
VSGALDEKAVAADLASTRFQVGEKRGHWRKVLYEFPILIVAIAGIEFDGKDSEYFFRFQLAGFPGIAPESKIWDVATNALLPTNKRPKGSLRVIEAFKSWGSESVYRPWDRHGGPHNNWTSTHPDLAWHPKRDLTFILEDLHGLLISNSLAHSNRPAA